MKYQSPLLVVEDMERAVAFYREVLGLRKTMDFGANVTMTGGVSLQTKESYLDFIGAECKDAIRFGGNDAELYFEEDDFDAFLEKLRALRPNYVHAVKEHVWGQRVVRIYDPDRHIIEIGENMKAVAARFLKQGMTAEEIADRMDVPKHYVKTLLR